MLMYVYAYSEVPLDVSRRVCSVYDVCPADLVMPLFLHNVLCPSAWPCIKPKSKDKSIHNLTCILHMSPTYMFPLRQCAGWQRPTRHRFKTWKDKYKI